MNSALEGQSGEAIRARTTLSTNASPGWGSQGGSFSSLLGKRRLFNMAKGNGNGKDPAVEALHDVVVELKNTNRRLDDTNRRLGRVEDRIGRLDAGLGALSSMLQ
ncbi:MAG TPA: hypothetical protein VMB50_21680 [Myxococcales bacterium]|nr:hypothetical protein [Myxococcales bacterium]